MTNKAVSNRTFSAAPPEEARSTQQFCRDCCGIPYYRKLTLHEIKVLEINATYINANLMENDFRIKKIFVKEEENFIIKKINAIKTQLVAEIKGEDIDITSDRDNDEDELEIL